MRTIVLVLLGLMFVACSDKDSNNDIKPIDERDNLTIKSDVLVPSFVGNGVQWGGYDILQSWTGSPTLSEQNWNLLFKRVQFMRPPLVRIMIAPGWNYIINGQYNPAKSEAVLFRILDFCQENNITVMFGEWGHSGGNSIDQQWLRQSADFLEYLLNVRGYTCIKYYNMVNEPNGDWSSINGNYALWRQLQEAFYTEIVSRNLDDRVGMIGPDVAVWGTDLLHWVTNAYLHLDHMMWAYDIHTYPSEVEVRNGTYQTMLRAYRNAASPSKPMIMGEVGFKYPSGSTLGQENQRRINADPYASHDSNMFIYDAFYGIDMADALIQNMLAGYAGAIIWGLDDAQYNIDGGNSTELKRWGFWNILGADRFENPDDVNIRPWFYPMSLLTRYFPAGSRIFNMELPAKRGLRAIAAEKDGKYTIAIVNSHLTEYNINLKMEAGISLNNINHYQYISLSGANFTGDVDTDGFPLPAEANLSLDFSNNAHKSIIIKGQSFHLFTNMD
jgi:hypothetical protein